MQEAARCLIGKHDFSSFRAAGCQANSPLRTLDALEVTRDGNLVRVQTAARSFLYHQVRNMVGSLVLVGTGQWTPAHFHDIFLAADRTQAGPTAPAQGLFFTKVEYEDKT
jgi:tRNA pseudouridine38-40 synthase